jgi:hypothetical protein
LHFQIHLDLSTLFLSNFTDVFKTSRDLEIIPSCIKITLQNQLQMNHVSERSTLLDGLYLTSKWFHLTLELHRYLVQQSSAAGQTLL